MYKKNRDIEFHLNTDIDLREIKDSMQLDSEQTIATLKSGERWASLEVRGDVKVFWNPNINSGTGTPHDGNFYAYPSEFPQELKDLIKEDPYWTTDERVYVSENNWFELFIYENKNDVCPAADVVDVEGCSGAQIFEMMLTALEENN